MLLPFLGSAIQGLRWAVYALALYSMGAHLWRHKLRWLFFGLAIFALVLTLLAMPEFKTPHEIALGMGVLILYTVAGLAIIRYLGRNNALFYPCAGFLLPCAGNAVKLLSQSSPWFMGNGVALVAIMGLVVLWLIMTALKGAGREG